MKIITTKSGEVRHGFEFKELSPKVQDKVLADQVDFEIEVMSGDKDSPYFYLVEEMERMHTPWFLASEIFHKHKEDLIATIEINEYLFDKRGEILPILTTFHKKKVVKVEYDGELCTIK